MPFKRPYVIGDDFVPTVHHDTYPSISPKNVNLSGRSVLITGASRGIGRATAISFAQAGASKIAIAARGKLDDHVNEIKQAATSAGRSEPQVLSITMDVVDETSVNAAAKAVTEAFGSIDYLLNNAGYLETRLPIAEANPVDWWKTWEVNIKGVFLVTRAFIPLLLSKKDGLKTIVNVSSIGALVCMPGASAYQTTKLALIKLSEHTNTEYGSQGLFAFNVHPGGVQTDLSSGLGEEMYATLNDTAELAGDTFAWLAGQDCEWLAGRYVSVNWDMGELMKKKEEIAERDLLKARVRFE